jgi:hypothetical protein
MRRLCVSLALLLVLGAAFAAAQPVPGKKFELGTAIALWSYSYENEDYSNSYTLLNVPVRFGWFFWKGLQLEPEIILTIPIGEDGGDVSYFLTGNLVYNDFLLKPGRTGPLHGFDVRGLPVRGEPAGAPCFSQSAVDLRN